MEPPRSSSSSPSPSSSPPGGRQRNTSAAPFGIKVIALLGLLGVIVAVPAIFVVVGAIGGLFGLVAGVVGGAILLGQVYVILGLLKLHPWAWNWGIALYVLNALLQFGSGKLVGGIVALVVAAYIYSKHDYYHGEKREELVEASAP